ncbi:MAG: orotidine 5'-phosphate decarboxylase [Chitinophagales bacterium]|nr:MAG: orotidine 5'-phosphate decarboxylase [Chitinophagales bacterium]
MTRKQLIAQILNKRSFLCIGLDTDITKIPQDFLKYDDPVYEFNKLIIDATKDFCVAYKLNTAFYEALGDKGWNSMYKTACYIPRNCLKIADAKRGDIGNTSEMYARAFFKTMMFDAITISPYMGYDSVAPYLQYPDKWIILLALTSNEGSKDFQLLKWGRKYFFEIVISKALEWGTPDNVMFVVGATHPDKLSRIRALAPDHFLLMPGVGAQGGDLDTIAEIGLNKEVGLLVSSSRDILYAGSQKDFLIKATKKAYQIQRDMELTLKTQNLI